MDLARTFSAEQRKKLAKQGQALPDGSFPIATKGDLRNAIQAYGRASNKAAAKRHIIKRARALGATGMLPDDWKQDSAQEEDMDNAEGIVTKPHKFSPQPDKPSLCASCNKSRGSGPHAKVDSAAEEAAESFSDTMAMLRRAVREQFGRRTYLVDASSDWVVYERFDEDLGEYRLMQRTYSVSDGAVSFDDGSTEVLRTTVYVPVAKQESASSLVEIWGASLATEHARAPEHANAIGQTQNLNSQNGTPASDAPHAFAQDEGSSPMWCATCGRSRRNPIHGGDESSTPQTPHSGYTGETHSGDDD